MGSVAFFCGIGLLGKYIILETTTKYIVTFLVWIFGMLMVTLYAPADTENVPIISKKERKKKRMLSYIALTVSLIIGLLIKNPVISSMIIYGMLFQSVTITRFAYKLTNNQYGYEVYNTSEKLA